MYYIYSYKTNAIISEGFTEHHNAQAWKDARKVFSETISNSLIIKQ